MCRGYHTPHKDQIVDYPRGCGDQLEMNLIQVKKMNVESIIAIKDMQYQRAACHLVADLLRPPTATQMPSLVQPRQDHKQAKQYTPVCVTKLDNQFTVRLARASVGVVVDSSLNKSKPAACGETKIIA